MAVVTINLWAKQGHIKFPDGVEVPFWGFATNAGGEPQLPGPVIKASVGDVLKINLHNRLSDFVSLIFPGQDFIPEPVKEDGVMISYNAHALPGKSVKYTFTANRPGLFLYESGTRPEKQVPMGLYGAIEIYPESFKSNQTAYGNNTRSKFDVEKLLILSELDSRFNLAMGAGNPFNMLDFEPDYWLINGRSFPYTLLPDDANFLDSQRLSAKVNSRPGQRILLRCINAGTQNHTFRLEGITARVVAVDSWPLMTGSGSVDQTYLKNTITVASGESYDLLLKERKKGQYYLHDRDLHHLCTAGQFPGGMATRLDVMMSIPGKVPIPPLQLTYSGLSPNSVLLNWKNDIAVDEEGFLVERKTGVGDFETVATLAVSGITEYTDSSVLSGANYVYRVRAYNSSGFSGYSNQCEVTVPGGISGPVNLTCTAESARQINLSWQNTSTDEDGYMVERRKYGTEKYKVIATLEAGTDSFHDSKVSANKKYYYRVRAFRGSSYSAYSNECEVRTPKYPPSAPSRLNTMYISSNIVILTWKDNSSKECLYLIERKTDANGNYSEIGRVGKNGFFYMDNTVEENKTYYYRVRAYSEKRGYSGYCHELKVIIPGIPSKGQ